MIVPFTEVRIGIIIWTPMHTGYKDKSAKISLDQRSSVFWFFSGIVYLNEWDDHLLLNEKRIDAISIGG
jgi:hypothetical protein